MVSEYKNIFDKENQKKQSWIQYWIHSFSSMFPLGSLVLPPRTSKFSYGFRAFPEFPRPPVLSPLLASVAMLVQIENVRPAHVPIFPSQIISVLQKTPVEIDMVCIAHTLPLPSCQKPGLPPLFDAFSDSLCAFPRAFVKVAVQECWRRGGRRRRRRRRRILKVRDPVWKDNLFPKDLQGSTRLVLVDLDLGRLRIGVVDQSWGPRGTDPLFFGYSLWTQHRLS